jgi:hypothetical protein
MDVQRFEFRSERRGVSAMPASSARAGSQVRSGTYNRDSSSYRGRGDVRPTRRCHPCISPPLARPSGCFCIDRAGSSVQPIGASEDRSARRTIASAPERHRHQMLSPCSAAPRVPELTLGGCAALDPACARCGRAFIDGVISFVWSTSDHGAIFALMVATRPPSNSLSLAQGHMVDRKLSPTSASQAWTDTTDVTESEHGREVAWSSWRLRASVKNRTRSRRLAADLVTWKHAERRDRRGASGERVSGLEPPATIASGGRW